MSIKAGIHKISDYTTAASLAALTVKYPLRKLGKHKANAAMMKLHEPASGAFLLAEIIHMATDSGSSKLKTLSGAAAFVTSVVLITDCHLAKDQTSKMQRHRVYSAVLTACAAIHSTVR